MQATLDMPKVQLPTEPTDTQDAAAHRMLPRSGTFRRRVYDFLVERGDNGATDEEVAWQLGLNPNTARPRRIELVAAKLVVDSGRRRKTRSGDKAAVWVVASA
jgi:transcription initiation factor IIE alpha subunit